MTGLAPTRTQLLGVFEHLLGEWYREDFVIAMIDAVKGPGAMKALEVAGFGSDKAHLCDSGEVSFIGKTNYERWTTFHPAAALHPDAMAEQDILADEYLAEAQSGASIITVLCTAPELVDDAGQVLFAHGARMVRHLIPASSLGMNSPPPLGC